MNNIEDYILIFAQCLPGLLFAIVIHEWAHGYIAMRFGDRTAQDSGRLTFNPAAHIDPFGTVMLPLLTMALGGMPFGYARPVPVDVRNFKNFRKGIFWVSFAGPLANFIAGTISALLYAIIKTQLDGGFSFYTESLKMLEYSIVINFVLGGFNLIPIPPLDGSKMVASFLKGELLRKYEEIGRYANFIFLGLFALSMSGVHIFGYILAPFLFMANLFTNLFLYMLS
jgi:Zn-dependent protease